MIEGCRIIYFGEDEWEFPGPGQQMARILAKKNEVVYVNSLGVRLPRPTWTDVTKMGSRLRTWMTSLARSDSATRVITPIALPFYNSMRLTRFSAWLVYRQLKALGIFPVDARTILWIALPTAEPIVDYLGNPPFFYYVADRQSDYPGVNREVIRTLEDKLAREARFCVGMSDYLLNVLREHNPNTYFIDYGVDFERFNQQSGPLPDELEQLSRPILGYAGSIADWLDQEALQVLARSRPQWSIVLLGACYTNIGELLKFNNVHWLGPRPHAEVPRFLAGFDVCLIPARLGEWYRYSNPLKLLEYFCTGKPVVSADLPTVTVHDKLVHIYHKPLEIAERAEEALNEPTELAEGRRAVARARAHPRDVEELCACIERHLLK